MTYSPYEIIFLIILLMQVHMVYWIVLMVGFEVMEPKKGFKIILMIMAFSIGELYFLPPFISILFFMLGTGYLYNQYMLELNWKGKLL